MDAQFERELLTLLRNATPRDQRVIFGMLTDAEADRAKQLKKEARPALKLVKPGEAR